MKKESGKEKRLQPEEETLEYVLRTTQQCWLFDPQLSENPVYTAYLLLWSQYTQVIYG